MEIFDSITNILSLFFGGSLISIVTWKFARRKAECEAKKAEAEAKQAEAEAQKEKQDYYQQMMEDLARDRDYYKTERDNLRTKLDGIIDEVQEIKRTGEEERSRLQMTIDSLTDKVDRMTPNLCFRKDCPNRIAATDMKCAKKTGKKKEPLDGIEPGSGNVF